jgi:hypothetical protein
VLVEETQGTDFGISRAQERKLLRSVASGTERHRKQAEAKLLEAYKPLIGAEVARFAAPSAANYEDLMQQGGMGLLEAARRFDLNVNVGLGSYARSAIQGAIKHSFGPADRELSGLAVEDLEGAPINEDAADQDGLDLGHAVHSSRPAERSMGEFLGGEASGRDAYLMHHAAETAELRVRFADWLAQSRQWTLLDDPWSYLVAAEPQLLAQARRGEDAGFAGLEQKYALLVEKLGLTERSHQAKEPRIGPDLRSEALARVVALAVEKGRLPELAWFAKRKLAAAPGFAEVGEFRRRYLDGELLGEDQVVAWIEEQARSEGSPAPAYVRVPLSEEDIAPFGDLAMAGSRKAYIAWLERSAQRARQAEVELPELRTSLPRPLLYGPRHAPQIMRIRGDGPLAALTAVVNNLRGHFDGWLGEDAVAFILAGVVPPLDKLRATTRHGHYRNASRITLDCDPRVAPSEVAAFYERLRRRWVTGRDRVMADKSLALAVFTEGHWRPDSHWADLQELWNAAHPAGDSLHSELSVNQFATECRVSWERLTGELWPEGKRAKRKLKADIAAAVKRGEERRAQLPD